MATMASTPEETTPRTNRTSSARRHGAVVGLLGAAGGIGLQKLAGVDMPAVPPSAVLLTIAAVALVGVRRRRWPGVVALVVLAAEAIGFVASGSIADLVGTDSLGVTAATWVRLSGILVAAVFLASRRSLQPRVADPR